MSNSVDKSVQVCSNAKEKTDKTEKIKFKLVNSENGALIEDIVLDVELPDGSFKIISSDVKGEVTIEGIDPGTCKLHTDWRELIDSGITIDQIVLLK